MALRQLRAIPRSTLLLPRFYSSNVPAKAAPPGTMENPVPSSSVGRLHPPIGPAYKSQGTAIGRTIRNIWKAGWKRAFWQIKEMNDTKVGTLVGVDRCLPLLQVNSFPYPHYSVASIWWLDNADCSLGNKYYEDMGELPLRERWVEYKVPHEYDSTQIEPGWYVL